MGSARCAFLFICWQNLEKSYECVRNCLLVGPNHSCLINHDSNHFKMKPNSGTACSCCLNQSSFDRNLWTQWRIRLRIPHSRRFPELQSALQEWGEKTEGTLKRRVLTRITIEKLEANPSFWRNSSPWVQSWMKSLWCYIVLDLKLQRKPRVPLWENIVSSLSIEWLLVIRNMTDEVNQSDGCNLWSQLVGS